MDRSFLSQSEVIAASRKFVCIRLTTYENEAELPFLQTLVRTRSGEVENSSFAILGPDGQQRLTRASRGIQSTYSDAPAMSKDMHRIVEKYSTKDVVSGLPLVQETHLALDVAASDNQPLVLIVTADATKRQEAEAALAKLIWQEKWIGKFVFCSTAERTALKSIDGLRSESIFCIIQPDQFGMKGKVLAQTAELQLAAIESVLSAGTKLFQTEPKQMRDHLREGQRQGVFWEPKTPVTDPQEVQARERGRKK